MRKGFTLAEILITLTIIGVVASLTIPSLINNIGDQQNRVIWKKTYADMSLAAMKLYMDNGGSLKNIGSNSDSLRNSFLSYLNYVKLCDSGVNDGVCWPSITKTLDGSTGNWFSSKSRIILNNGTMLSFFLQSQNCSMIGGGNGSLPVCAEVGVDVNGLNGPNTSGKDIFGFWVVENGIKPFGVLGDLQNCSTNGGGCSAQYLYQ